MAGHFTIYDTNAGRCAIAWTTHGIAGLQLPEADEAALRAAMSRKHAGFTESAPTKAVTAAIAGIPPPSSAGMLSDPRSGACCAEAAW